VEVRAARGINSSFIRRVDNRGRISKAALASANGREFDSDQEKLPHMLSTSSNHGGEGMGHEQLGPHSTPGHHAPRDEYGEPLSWNALPQHDGRASDANNNATSVEDLIQDALRARELCEEDLKDYRADLQKHRDQYDEMWHTHERGFDPGLSDWDPEWSRETFDLEHLRKMLQLTKTIREGEDGLQWLYGKCVVLGVEPSKEQISCFPRAEWSESRSMDAPRIASAPREHIHNWLDNLPPDMTALALPWSRPTSVFDQSRHGLYPEEHFVEYPDDMDLTCGPDLNPGDSASLVDTNMPRRITYPGRIVGKDLVLDDYPLNDRLGKREQWQAPGELQQLCCEACRGSSQLRSHMC
jgi:hypothetical protein